MSYYTRSPKQVLKKYGTFWVPLLGITRSRPALDVRVDEVTHYQVYDRKDQPEKGSAHYY